MQPQTQFFTVNGIRLHVQTAGNPASPTILFLHGFPSFWYSWKKHMEYFVSQNYFVIVPDQRGYNRSDKPRGVKSYRLSLLVEDMVALLSQSNIEKAFIVSHDWGGVVAWSVIKQHPELCRKVVVINAPYLPSYLHLSFRQLVKSWYVYFFQLPFLPESSMRWNHFSLLARSLKNSSLPDTFSKEDLERYKDAWRQKGALTAMINWYRALIRYPSDARQIFGNKQPINIPVMMLWGAKDKFLQKESAVCPPKHATRFQIKEFADATHWLPLEKADDVNKTILQFFQTEE